MVLVVMSMGLTPSRVSAENEYEQYFSGSYYYFEWLDDEITNTNKLETELGLRYRNEGFSAFARLSSDRPLSYQTDQFQLTKRGFNYELNDDWEISGGHYSLVFARGMAMNAIENRPLDRDAQLDGLLVEGNLSFGNLTAFWGRHKSDNLEYYISGVNTLNGDPADELMGARLDIDLDDLDVGISYTDADITRFGTQESTTVTEIDARWKIEDLTFYYESAWFGRDEPEGFEESLDGRGQLAEILYGERGFSLGGSWVRYDKAHWDYGTAPSLRRFEIDDSEARSDDETGYRFDLRYSPDNWEGNSMRVLYADLNGIENKDQPFTNYFIEWASPQTGDWSGSISYDYIDGFMLFYGAIDGRDTSWRGTLDGPFPLGGTFHLYTRLRHLTNEFESDDEMEIGLDIHATPEFTFGFFRETSTRESEPTPPGLFDISSESPGHWNAGFIRYTPDPWTDIELTLGAQRGGFQCSGGTCAQLPPFKGFRITYYRSF